MTHPDPEVLTQLALNDPLSLDADVLVHIADCEQCSAEVAALQRVVTATELLRNDATLREVIRPPDRVWDRIALNAGIAPAGQHVAARESATSVPQQPELSDEWLFSGESTEDDGDGVPVPTADSGSDNVVQHRPRRRIGGQLMAAAVIGVLVGALFTWALTGRDDDDGGGGSGSGNGETVFTTSDLVGLDGHTTSGVASFVESPTGGEVTIELEPGNVGEGFIQAWLLDEDTGGMVALGVIDGDEGTFAVPKDLDLTAFNQIDISLEPYDGNPEHSAVSLARGPLP